MLSLNNSLNINLSQPINSKDASTGAHFDAGFWCHYQVAFWQAFKKVADVEPAAVAAKSHYGQGTPVPTYQIRFWEDYKAMARVLPRDEVATAVPGRYSAPKYQADFWSAVKDGKAPELVAKLLEWRENREFLRQKAGLPNSLDP